MRSISFEKYFSLKQLPPLIDVRSPGEFEKGHVPRAFNLPLFSNEERAEVGTLYKQTSREAAMLKGLEIAGKKITTYVTHAKKIIKGKDVCFHCWRGGRRSTSMATLIEFMGYNVMTLEGGYKAYRRFVRREFHEKKMNLIVLGGKTGAGKTDVLKELSHLGEQVIDLEKLACHKGSAFGALGEKPQPTVEQFENNLYEELRKMNLSNRVWIENESKSIGRIFVPDGFWEQLGKAVFFELDVPFENRVERLVREYDQFPKEELIAAVEKIKKRMGGQNVKAAIEAYEKGHVEDATAIALRYYDKAYQHATDQKEFSVKHLLESTNAVPFSTAEKLIEQANEHGY